MRTVIRAHGCGITPSTRKWAPPSPIPFRPFLKISRFPIPSVPTNDSNKQFSLLPPRINLYNDHCYLRIAFHRKGKPRNHSWMFLLLLTKRSRRIWLQFQSIFVNNLLRGRIPTNYYLSLVSSSPAFSETQESRNNEHPRPDRSSAPLRQEQLFAARAPCPLASFRM